MSKRLMKIPRRHPQPAAIAPCCPVRYGYVPLLSAKSSNRLNEMPLYLGEAQHVLIIGGRVAAERSTNAVDLPLPSSLVLYQHW